MTPSGISTSRSGVEAYKSLVGLAYPGNPRVRIAYGLRSEMSRYINKQARAGGGAATPATAPAREAAKAKSFL